VNCDFFVYMSTNNSDCICAEFSHNGLMESVTLRLKRLRESATPRVTQKALAEALGMPTSTYTAYEDPSKFKKPILPLDFAKRVADHLSRFKVDPAAVLELAGLDGDRVRGVAGQTEKLPILGEVAAGVWREQSDWPTEDLPEIEVGPNPIPGAERFAVRMVGLSMDRTIPPGSVLECVRVQFGVIDPRPGDIVVVSRQRNDMNEMTCKRLAREDGEWVLQFESTRPEYQNGAIRLGNPNPDTWTDDGVQVTGIVLRAHLEFYQPRS
jgi:SOS-response transcriptional repressor LexA